jgi:hypothetical protein
VYVNRGVGAVRARRPGGPRVIPVPQARYRGFGLIRGRGMGASGSTPATCTAPNYWNGGQNQCCAPLGTAPAADPCSILNQPGYLAAQASDVGPLGSNGVPLSAGNGPGAAELAEVAGYPNNVQTDAINCWSNPGLLFVNSMGQTVSCPAASVNDNGIMVSAYTPGQLAAMLAPTDTPSTSLVGNSPFAAPAPVNNGPLPSASSSSSGSAAPSVNLSNSSGGSSNSFNVGDSWQIVVTGAPNATVQASASQNGTSLGTSTMGTIGANGQLILQGTFTSSQVGNWTESWTVGGQSAGSITFSVAAASGNGGTNSGGTGAGGGASNTGGSGSGSSTNSNPFGFLTDTFSIAGVAIPYWAAGGAVLLGLFFFTGRRG